MPQTPFNFVKFLLGGQGADRFSGLGGLGNVNGQSPGQQPATPDAVQLLRTFLLNNTNPAQLNSHPILGQQPGVNSLLRLNSRNRGNIFGGGGGGPGGPGGAGAGGGGGQR